MIKTEKEPNEFWITNACNRDVMLSDLYLSVKAYKSVNLLNKKHFYYTWEQIVKSCTSGSIFKKSKIIKIRDAAPIIVKKRIAVDREAFAPSREKSVYEINQEKFEELSLSDEDFAADNSEL